MEGLTVVYCELEPFLQTLVETVDGALLLPGLQRLAVYVGCGDMDEVESLREVVGELVHCVGEAPKLWRDNMRDLRW